MKVKPEPLSWNSSITLCGSL